MEDCKLSGLRKSWQAGRHTGWSGPLVEGRKSKMDSRHMSKRVGYGNFLFRAAAMVSQGLWLRSILERQFDELRIDGYMISVPLLCRDRMWENG